jgi:hypothetical protein
MLTLQDFSNFFYFFGAWSCVYHASSVCLSAICQTYTTLPTPTQRYVDSCVMSVLHSAFISGAAIFMGYSENVGIFLYELPLSFYSIETDALIQIMVGYFAVDLLNSLYYLDLWSGYQETIIHHTVCLAGLYIVYVKKTMHNILLAGMVLEITTPIVSGRIILDKCGAFRQYPSLKLIVGGIMTVSFFFVRIVYFTNGMWVAFDMHHSELAEYDLSLTFTCYTTFMILLCLQYHWFGKIMSGIIKLVYSYNHHNHTVEKIE